MDNIYKVILNDGELYLLRYGSKLLTMKNVYDEDWKTAIARGYGCIPKGSEVIFIDTCDNFYGKFIVVKYNNINYYVKAKDFSYINLL